MTPSPCTVTTAALAEAPRLAPRTPPPCLPSTAAGVASALAAMILDATRRNDRVEGRDLEGSANARRAPRVLAAVRSAGRRTSLPPMAALPLIFSRFSIFPERASARGTLFSICRRRPSRGNTQGLFLELFMWGVRSRVPPAGRGPGFQVRNNAIARVDPRARQAQDARTREFSTLHATERHPPRQSSTRLPARPRQRPLAGIIEGIAPGRDRESIG